MLVGAEAWEPGRGPHRPPGVPFVVGHEYPERRLVWDGGRGYESVSAPEFDLRKDEGLTEPRAHSRAGARRSPRPA